MFIQNGANIRISAPMISANVMNVKFQNVAVALVLFVPWFWLITVAIAIAKLVISKKAKPSSLE